MSVLIHREPLIPACFQKIIVVAALTDRDIELYRSHRTSIRSALANASGFELDEVVPIGSFARRSAVHGISDSDLLAVLRKRTVSYSSGQLYSPGTVTSNVRGVLAARFWATGVGRDGQAIVVDFGDGEHPVDLVPAVWQSATGFHNHPVFIIPDGAGGWMSTSPSSHNRYIDGADQGAGGKLKYVAQIFKTWCHTRSTPVPVRGFHVELLLASTGICAGARAYAAIFRDLLTLLRQRDCAALNDPLGISGRIAATGTDAKRESAMRTIAEAAYHADLAVFAEAAGNEAEAWRQWNIVFNDRFPR
jgi:hypothetical protein